MGRRRCRCSFLFSVGQNLRNSQELRHLSGIFARRNRPEHTRTQTRGIVAQLFDGEMKKGEAAAQRCIAIGKEWKLEETERYQSALAKLEGNVQSNVQN